MPIEHINANWIMDMETFEKAVQYQLVLQQVSSSDCDEMLGFKRFVSAMENGEYSRYNKMPTLRNYLEICNLLGLNPTAYFTTE